MPSYSPINTVSFLLPHFSDIAQTGKRRSLVASTSLNLSRNPLKEKVLFHSKFYFENQIWLIERYARKSIYHGCMVWIEKSVTRDHCSASLGKPCDADQ